MSLKKESPFPKAAAKTYRKISRKSNRIGGLRESEAKYRGFIENLAVMFYAAEPQPPYSPIYTSPAFAQFGYPLAEWNQSSDLWTRILHPEDREWVLAKTDAAMRAGAETDYEYRIIARDGTVIWVRDRGSFVRDETGELTCWQGIILDITDRKNDEQKLRRSEKLYRTLAHSIPQTGVVLFDRSFRYTLADGVLLERHGFSREMFEGKSLREVFPPDIYEEWAGYYRRALGGETISFEQTDDKGCFQIYVVPVKNEDDEIFAGMVVWQDISERRRAEQSTIASEQRYREMFEKNQAIKLLIDADTGAIVDVNPAACQFYGYGDAEFKTKNIAALNTLPFEQIVRYLEQAKDERRNCFQFQHRLASGEVRDVEVRSSPLQDRERILLYSIIQDVTERRQAEEALRQSEARYRDIYENANDLIYVHDLKGNYLSINKATERVIGYSLEEALQMNLRQVIAPEHLNYARRRLADKLAGEHQAVYETECIAKNGQRVTLEVNSSVIYKDGAPIAVQGVARDVTERRLTEQRIQQSEAQMQAIFSAMTDIVMVFDAEGRHLRITQAMANAYKPALNLVGRKIHEIFPLPLADYFLKNIRRCLEERRSVQIEYRLQTGAENCWFAAVISPMMTDSVVVVARDVSESKRAEKVLQEREEEYRELFENANDLIYTRDMQGRFTSLNKTGEAISGYTREEVVGRSISEMLAPDYLDKAREINSRLNEGEPAIAYELVMISKQGRRIPLELNTRLIVRDGKPVGVQGIARDITERKRAENVLRQNEAKLKDLFDNAPLGYHELDRDGRIVRVNRTELELLGYQTEEMVGYFVWEFVVETEARRAVLNKLSGAQPLKPVERTFRRKDGSTVPILIEERLIKDENGQITGIRSTLQDITKQKRAEQALKDSEQKYRLLGEGVMHQVWTARPDGRLDYINRRTIDYFGRAHVRKSGGRWQHFVHPEDLEKCDAIWRRCLETGEDYVSEYRLRRHDGEYFWFQGRGTAGRDADGAIVSWFGTNTDIDDQKKAEAKLSHIAGHDTLTDLPNRTKFMQHLERAVSRAANDSAFRFAVLFLDLDRFKVINDSLGHTTGDKLLVALAKRLEECLRPNDIVARLGGDEFTILLPDIREPAVAVSVAERIQQKLSVPFNLDVYEVFTSASIGIIVSDEVKRQPEDFLRDADTAMYRAKEAGKARYEIFDRAMHIRNLNLLQLETDLRRAIERDEFRVFYQPIVWLETGEIREFEALIRWQHPQHGLVPPNEFIGIAEETGLIVPIGRWILENACRQTAEWQRQIPNCRQLSVSVNLSAKQLLHPNIIAQVKEVLERTAFDPRCLKLEATETMVMENGDQALAVISELNKLGISLSTDDFGTGYSSLSYLHRFPFSCLKIDRSFVSKMDSDAKSEAIVRTILLLAQNLNIKVVAEGIETASQLNSLRQLGCQTGQGYLFSKPVPADQAAELLRNGLPESAASLYRLNKPENSRLLELDKVQ